MKRTALFAALAALTAGAHPGFAQSLGDSVNAFTAGQKAQVRQLQNNTTSAARNAAANAEQRANTQIQNTQDQVYGNKLRDFQAEKNRLANAPANISQNLKQRQQNLTTNAQQGINNALGNAATQTQNTEQNAIRKATNWSLPR